MSPQHTPALAHNALKPQAIARRRAFRKATHRFAPRAARKRTRLPRARSRTTTRDKHYSCTLWLVGVRGFGTVLPLASRRQAPPRSTSRRRAPGHPPARVGPRMSRPLGRSPLSVPGGPLASPEAPLAWATNKEKEVRCNARRRQRDEYRQASADKAAEEGGCATEEMADRRRQRRQTCGSGPANLRFWPCAARLAKDGYR